MTLGFPSSWSDAAALSVGGTVRAGGTDISERRRLGVLAGELVDLRELQRAPGGRSLSVDPDGSLRVGALVPMEAAGADPVVRAAWPAFAIAASNLATPAIRRVGTVGGNLIQGVRCWYFRSPEFHCLRKGGGICHARDGEHENHTIFDRGACVAVHPSTLAAALLACDATVVTTLRELPVADLLGDGADPRRTHQLGEGELIREILLPPPPSGIRGAYQRATGRVRAEWPIVECAVHLVQDGLVITWARVVVGAVAAVPLRLEAVEGALLGQPATEATVEAAAKRASEGAKPLRDNEPKLRILEGTVRSTLHDAMGLS